MLAERAALIPSPRMASRPRRRITYTLEEANALLPQVRAVLLQMAVEQRRLDVAHEALHQQLAGNGEGSTETEMGQIRDGIHALLTHLEKLGIQLRDPEVGLVDFPGERDGVPVWLCWRLADPSVAYWHGTDEGFASRRPW